MRNHREQKKGISSLITYPALIALCLSGVIKSCTPMPINGTITIEEEVSESHTKTFLPGEHIVSIPVGNKTNSLEIEQYPYQEGYKCLGESCDNTGAVALYVNTEAVNAKSYYLNSDGDYVYPDFGVPTEKHNNSTEDEDSKIFEAGEHVISVPISNPVRKNQQYYTHEGYEPLDISYYASGRHSSFKGATILYVNTVPVKCDKINEEYASFGTPIQQEKTLTK